MLLFLVTFFFLFTDYLQAKQLPYPQLADFANMKLDQTFVNYMPACRTKYGGEFNHKFCDRVEYKCDWKETFYRKVVTPINVTVPEALSKYLNPRRASSLYFLVKGDKPQVGHLTEGAYRFYDQEGSPLGMEADFYMTIQYYNQIEIISLGKATLQKEINLSDFQIPKNKIRIEKDNTLPEHGYLIVTLNSHPLNQLNQGAYEIFISPGVYDLAISNGQNAYSKTVTMAQTNQTIVLNKNMLVPIKDKGANSTAFLKDKRIEWSKSRKESLNDYQDSFSIRTNYMAKEELFQSIDKIQITSGATTTDVTNLFNLGVMNISVKADKSSEYEKIISSAGSFEIKVDGICETASLRPSKVNYQVLAEPKEDSKILGEVVVEFAHRNVSVRSYFVTPDKQEINNSFNFATEKCQTGAALLHLVRETENNYVNLGKGAWGDSGWAIVPTIDPFSEAYKFAFKKEDVEFVKFSKKGKRLEAIEWSTESPPKNSFVNPEDLLAEDNKLKFRCDYDR